MNAIRIYEALPEAVPASRPAQPLPRFDAHAAFGLPPEDRSGPSQRFVLKRAGARPLRFSGVELGREESRGDAPRYVLALYRMDDGRHVAQIEAQDAGAQFGEPLHQIALLLASFESHDAFPDLAQDNRVHDDLRIVLGQPVDDSLLETRFRRLREDIGIDEESHSAKRVGGASVVSSERSGSENQPFTGQSSSTSTTRRLGLASSVATRS